MPWLLLLASAVLEAIWATALGASDGLREPVPALIFVVTLALSMVGLGRAARDIPIGTAYAVWTGVGAALTVTWAMAVGGEAASIPKLLFLTGIVAAVVGLRFAGESEPGRAGRGPH